METQNEQKKHVAGGIIGAIGGGLMILGIFLPWFYADLIPVPGIKMKGGLIVILLLGAAAVVFFGISAAVKKLDAAPIFFLFGIPCAIILVILLIKISGEEVGIGVPLTVIGLVAIITAASMTMTKAVEQEPQPQPGEQESQPQLAAAYLEEVTRAPSIPEEKTFDKVNVYEDQLLTIAWEPTPSALNFKLFNKTEETIKVIWDECGFINSSGESKRTLHVGVRFLDMNNPMPPSIIPAGGNLVDLLFPTDYLDHTSGQNGGWKQRELYSHIPSAPENFGTFLTVKVGRKKYQYNFKFIVSSLPIYPCAKLTGDAAAPGETPSVEIKENMTITEVEALLGLPEKSAKIGNQTKYVYDDWKITFEDGKVTAVDF